MIDDASDAIQNSAATAATPAPQDDAAPRSIATATTAFSDAGDASATPVAALVNDLAFTLTVGQARALFANRGRKVPAERTLQSYCIEGTIAAQKIRTTYGAEWLINEVSLLAHIEQQPVISGATAATPAPQDDAAPRSIATATTAFSDAGDASPAQLPVSVGERRTLADVLIENAKLLATIDGKDDVLRGKDETIAELKDDRGFLRDEVREARQQRKDVKDIASRMLDAMQNIAIAGKLPPAKSQNDNITARVIHPYPDSDAHE
jgi:hypothetical protein